MGGAAGGELASQLAVDAFLHSIGQSAATPAEASQNPSTNPAVLSIDHPQTRLERAVRAANLAVFQRAQKNRSLRGMGTTLVAALVQRTETATSAWIAHVGDSRCYLLRATRLQQLTTDHSVVEEQIRAGFITREQAEFSPVRNVITRAVGTQLTVPTDVVEVPTQPGDLVLLASDGLTRELSDDTIAHLLGEHAGNLDLACESLIAAANARGGRDNITVLLIAID
jgi:protein phosphatase